MTTPNAGSAPKNPLVQAPALLTLRCRQALPAPKRTVRVPETANDAPSLATTDQPPLTGAGTGAASFQTSQRLTTPNAGSAPKYPLVQAPALLTLRCRHALPAPKRMVRVPETANDSPSLATTVQPLLSDAIALLASISQRLTTMGAGSAPKNALLHSALPVMVF